MTDEPITPEEQARNRRPFGSVIGWLMSGEHRRPGMLGAAVSLQGRAGPSKAQLTRSRDGWELATPDASENLATVDVVALIGTGKFFPRTVDVVPELAELLFQEAVHQAEQSLLQLSAARSSVEEHLERDPANILGPFVMASASLDRSVRASIGSIVLAIASAEAQANRWADILGGWQGGEDRLSVAAKAQVLADRCGVSISLGTTPYQELANAIKRRNSLVHAMPVAEAIAP